MVSVSVVLLWDYSTNISFRILLSPGKDTGVSNYSNRLLQIIKKYSSSFKYKRNLEIDEIHVRVGRTGFTELSRMMPRIPQNSPPQEAAVFMGE